MNLVPVKFRVAQIIFLNEGISGQEIIALLKSEYPLDRNTNEKSVEEYLLSLKAVGLIELANVTQDDKGKLKLFYKMTNYGASRIEIFQAKNRLIH